MPINRCAASSSAGAGHVSLSDVDDPRLAAITPNRRPPPMAVSRQIFEAMGIAGEVMRKTGYQTFPDGPGNQEAAMVMSGGRNWTRMKMARDMIQGGHCSTEAEELAVVKEWGGGSCGEHRRLVAAEYSQLPRDLPVIQVKDAGVDHNYVIVGDWRDRRVGEHAVVVDPWPMLKKVFTYGERSETASPVPLMTTPPGPPDPDAARAAALAVPATDSARMDRFTKMRLKRPAGPEAARALVHGLRQNGSGWDQAAATTNVHQQYASPDGRVCAFNEVPTTYLRQYLDAKDELGQL
jgi:hypothetical protein